MSREKTIVLYYTAFWALHTHGFDKSVKAAVVDLEKKKKVELFPFFSKSHK